MIAGYDVRGVVELGAIAAIFVGLCGTIWIGANRGIGPRMIQFAGAIMLVPVILILALEKLLETSTLGTVIGAVIGYLLSGISEATASRPNPPPP
jgi:hypothetical protein